MYHTWYISMQTSFDTVLKIGLNECENAEVMPIKKIFS